MLKKFWVIGILESRQRKERLGIERWSYAVWTCARQFSKSLPIDYKQNPYGELAYTDLFEEHDGELFLTNLEVKEVLKNVDQYVCDHFLSLAGVVKEAETKNVEHKDLPSLLMLPSEILHCIGEHYTEL